MALTAPPTFVDLQTVTAAQLNAVAGWYSARPVCALGGTTGTTVASSTTAWVTFSWTNAADELRDAEAMHDIVTNPSRITIQTAGLYRLTGSIAFGSSTAGTARAVRLLKNGATLSPSGQILAPALAGFGSGLVGTVPTTSIIVRAIAGDYYEMQGLQDSGSSASYFGYFSAEWLAP